MAARSIIVVLRVAGLVTCPAVGVTVSLEASLDGTQASTGGGGTGTAEPATPSLFAVAGVALARRRRR